MLHPELEVVVAVCPRVGFDFHGYGLGALRGPRRADARARVHAPVPTPHAQEFMCKSRLPRRSSPESAAETTPRQEEREAG
eukprot:3724750-Alexandrium_andersonii.AAC.1